MENELFTRLKGEVLMEGSVKCMGVSPCRRMVAVGMNNKRLVILRTDTFKVLSIIVHSEIIKFINMSNDFIIFGNNKEGNNSISVLPLN